VTANQTMMCYRQLTNGPAFLNSLEAGEFDWTRRMATYQKERQYPVAHGHILFTRHQIASTSTTGPAIRQAPTTMISKSLGIGRLIMHTS